MSADIRTKPLRRTLFNRAPRHITNHEEARQHHLIEDRPNLRDQTSFGVGRAGIPG